jgi:multidrug resistance efflux pump
MSSSPPCVELIDLAREWLASIRAGDRFAAVQGQNLEATMRLNRKLLCYLIAMSLLWGLVGCDSMPLTSGDEGGLSASGVVETVEVAVAPEIGGRVVEVYVAEGDPVAGGDPLLRLDDELLRSQRRLVVAALEAAQSNLATAQTGVEMAEASLRAAEANLETVAANAEVESLAASRELDELYKSHGVMLSEAFRGVATANRALREAQYRLDNFTVPLDQKDMTALEGVAAMRARLDEAREAFEPYKYRDSSDSTRQDRKEDLDEAQSDYDSAVRRLEYETDFENAQALLDKALDDLETLQAGPDPDDVAVLEARLAAAESAPKGAQAAVEQARVGLAQAGSQLDGAGKAVEQAGASLDLIDAQMAKLSLAAPATGVVLVRVVEPGEVLQPGSTALIIGQLSDLTITVYIPEDRYGQISLGEPARVSVDSFPGEVFQATVVRIADRAEYTPRNTQTEEERVTTVFAIKLAVDDPEGKLKPGMPADVAFSQ